MTVPTGNVINLYFNGATGSLVLTPFAGTNFQVDQGNGLSIAAGNGGPLESLTFNATNLTLEFADAFYGEVNVNALVGENGGFNVSGSFSPYSVMFAWPGQIGGAEALGPGSTFAINS